MKISARNRLAGTVSEVTVGTVAAKVVVNFDKPGTITATITKDAVQDMNLKVGDSVEAVVKASNVMILKP
ncbi:MAG TPA: TOBE domain-containing protein [Clostridia bacterium]|nr:TOBE domain-containing protein [Clostridia bacterium]